MGDELKRGDPHIEIQDLTMAYGNFVVQSGLTFTINKSDIFTHDPKAKGALAYQKLIRELFL